ncbi:Oligoribonuclease, mitochondrial [Larimichthys crocea]|uniref:Oligoribonuclease, mitochondrial n=1 Tax=Larimichthys crocea TaxID=215358 RepID=A0A6G0I9Y2_LARCR|nr:Oligoribonuclease, mitochondrial [Larimichthys crocea]
MSARLRCLNPACAALTWGFLCRNTRPVLRASKAAHHLHRTSAGVLRKHVLCNGLTGSGAGTDGTYRGGGSGFNVQVSRRVSMTSGSMSQRMVWVDLEMTGLDVDKDRIIEMACIITDSDLNILAEGPNLIINQPDSLLDGMSDWCKEHHGKSGLTQAVRDSKITLEQAEYEFLSFVRQHTPPGQCPLAGNSVHADKRFLDKYMPQLCTTFTTGSSTSAPSRSSADGGFQKNTRLCLTRKHPTERWTTSGRALKSCSTTEPTSSKRRQKRRSVRSWRTEATVCTHERRVATFDDFFGFSCTP